MSFIYLLSGFHTSFNKRIQIVLNGLLLPFFIFMIMTDAFEDTFSGLVLMIIILFIVILGMIGIL